MDNGKAQEPQGRDRLVVVGSSAGGAEALSVLVARLPKDFRAPIVIAQHLAPDRPSQLAAILERRTQLPIVVVEESTSLEPGHIYVVSSNRQVTVKDSRVEVKPSPGSGPRPSVDLLLSSAARSYGERLIAVLLTGSGTDGAVGGVDVKNRGGTVILQNPETARYPSMPLALPPTAVDHVVELEDIGRVLVESLNDSAIVESAGRRENQDALEGILQRVSARQH